MNYGKISSYQTGVVVPLFSLLSKDSVGIGEFLDLIPFGKWAKKCGLDLIQLLPVNDTGEESSPYSARSAFALNPVYIRLQEVEGAHEILGEEPDKHNKKFMKHPRIPYVEVVRYKRHALREIFNKRRHEILGNEHFTKWLEQNEWVNSYAVFCALKAENHEASWKHWEKKEKPKASDVMFQKWMQWVAEEQFLKAVSELNKLGIRLKGDIPILINEDSADAWHYPQFFSLDNRAGAPPDMFCYSGQNWAFPTYKWDNLERENFSWWRDRIKHAAKFYHAYRIDHVLGFFRIWVVPEQEYTGILGHFVPSIPIYMNELAQAGIPRETVHYLTNPNFGDEQLQSRFGPATDMAKQKYFEPLQGSYGRYILRNEYHSERSIMALDEDQHIKDALLNVYWDRVFTPSSGEEVLHPYWYWYNSSVLLTLPEHERNTIKNVMKHNEEIQEDLWGKNGHKLLEVLSKEADMLVCAEDLGAVPNCVPGVLESLGILALRVERWHRDWKQAGQPYIPLSQYPRLSVCTTSNHDSSTLLGLWTEHDFDKDFYWKHIGGDGSAPAVLNAGHVNIIIKNLFHSNSLVAILPLQDFMALSQKFIPQNPEIDRVNVPGTIGPQNWSWRMSCHLEDLLKENELNHEISNLVEFRRNRTL
ncbi:MAG: 4-alpha-glucanotransferase [Fibromonadaceae bacterium]|jgi:4-alpha-glucanotransferase|nr:4-alpha-glucanotransferase [Fibromonadaceae bacterium]